MAAVAETPSLLIPFAWTQADPCVTCGAEQYDASYCACDHCGDPPGCSECRPWDGGPEFPLPCCTLTAEDNAAADRQLFEAIGYRGGFMTFAQNLEVIRAR